MKLRIPAALVALLCAACASTGNSPDAVAFDEAAMMEKWMAYMTPGPAHKVLDQQVGKWDLKVTMYNPDGTSQTSSATSEVSWLMDGRYLQETVNGSFEGMPFQGRGTVAYDNMKKCYVSTWIDNMGTGIMTSEGRWDAGSRKFTYEGASPDVLRGEYVNSKNTMTQVDDNHWTMEMWGPGPDGNTMKVMEITYTRKS